MKSKTIKLLSALLAIVMFFGLFAAMPLTVSAKPEIPTDLTATVVPGGVTLNWTKNGDDEVGFLIYRSEGSDPMDSDIHVYISAPADTTTYTDTTVEPGKTYGYRIQSAITEKAWTGLSNWAIVTIPSGVTPFQVTEQPVGADYYLNEVPVPLTATFEYDALAGLGYIDSRIPITVMWYWSDENSNTDRSNGFAESTVAYARQIKHTTTHIPATDTVGVKYYYAVIRYGESAAGDLTVTTETVTDPARIEVIDPGADDVTPPEQHDFTVKKTDENGEPLAGATLRLEGLTEDGIPRVYDLVTDSNGEAKFTAEEGNYMLSEYAAPQGYNATDDAYNIIITANGVYIQDSPTHSDPYTTVTFVNKEIPLLNKDDHFAYMQGYPEGTFGPSRNMTRAEAVVMFSRLLEEAMDLDENHRNSYYPDVDPAKWYANQVGYMQERGVLADYSRDGNFRPDDPVTRAEFATLAAHFDDLTLTDVNKFIDVADDHWAVKYINSAAAKGWIIGYTDNTFKPEAYITRAEVVTLVNRILERSADKAYIAANADDLPRSYSDINSMHWAYWDIMEASVSHDFTKQGADEKWTAVYE